MFVYYSGSVLAEFSVRDSADQVSDLNESSHHIGLIRIKRGQLPVNEMLANYWIDFIAKIDSGLINSLKYWVLIKWTQLKGFAAIKSNQLTTIKLQSV